MPRIAQNKCIPPCEELIRVQERQKADRLIINETKQTTNTLSNEFLIMKTKILMLTSIGSALGTAAGFLLSKLF